VARKFGTTQILGIVLGITLVSPQLLNAYGVAGGAEIPQWDFGFFQIDMIGYQAQVIPAMLAGFTLVYLEKFFKKIVPEYLSMILVPFFALIPTVLLAHVVLGPIGWVIGDAISSVVYGGLTSAFGWLFASVFGFLYAPLVITGLHHMTNAIDLQLMNEFGGTNLWPMIALSNIAQGSAVLAIIFLHRGNKEEQQHFFHGHADGDKRHFGKACCCDQYNERIDVVQIRWIYLKVIQHVNEDKCKKNAKTCIGVKKPLGGFCAEKSGVLFLGLSS